MSDIYIHYGSNSFDKTREYEPYWKKQKPHGLWASRENSEFGWKEFSEDNNFHMETLDKYFRFILDDSTKILTIRKEEDIVPYIVPWEQSEQYKRFKDERFVLGFGPTSLYDDIDIKRIMENYDAMELIIDEFMGLHVSVFSLWDCTSICVWNLDKVIPL